MMTADAMKSVIQVNQRRTGDARRAASPASSRRTRRDTPRKTGNATTSDATDQRMVSSTNARETCSAGSGNARSINWNRSRPRLKAATYSVENSSRCMNASRADR